MLDRDFWLGLDTLHMLTSVYEQTELRVDLRFPNGTALFAHYNTFHVANEQQNYQLTVTDYDNSSTVDDSLSGGVSPHNGREFTTYDRDNDGLYGFNCAEYYELHSIGGGGWWYNSCGNTLLTANYFYTPPDRSPGPPHLGVVWTHQNAEERFTFVELKMRPKSWHCQNIN